MHGRAAPVRRATRVSVRILSVLFVGTSFFVGVSAIVRHIGIARRDAGLSVFPAEFREQLERVRQAAPGRAGILLLAGPDDLWNARLWQRALFPGNPVLVRLPPLPDRRELHRLRAEYRADLLLSFGEPPPGLTLAWREDLGGMLGGPDHLWLGGFAP